MCLCRHNPQLLVHEWAVQLVRRLSGKVNDNGWTALIRLFKGTPEKVDFSSRGFKLLWEKEKNIEKKKLIKKMSKRLDLKKTVVAIVPDAE